MVHYGKIITFMVHYGVGWGVACRVVTCKPVFSSQLNVELDLKVDASTLSEHIRSPETIS
jgi:hypothetical protein